MMLVKTPSSWYQVGTCSDQFTVSQGHSLRVSDDLISDAHELPWHCLRVEYSYTVTQ